MWSCVPLAVDSVHSTVWLSITVSIKYARCDKQHCSIIATAHFLQLCTQKKLEVSMRGPEQSFQRPQCVIFCDTFQFDCRIGGVLIKQNLPELNDKWKPVFGSLKGQTRKEHGYSNKLECHTNNREETSELVSLANGMTGDGSHIVRLNYNSPSQVCITI